MAQLKELQGSFDDLGSAVRKAMRDLDQIIGKRNIRMLRGRGAKNMFKVGQVWRSFDDNVFVVERLCDRSAFGAVVKGYLKGFRGRVGVKTALHEGFTLIGNNYKPKALPEQRGCRKEDC